MDFRPTFPIDRSADRAVEFISGDDQRIARNQAVRGFRHLQDAESIVARIVDDLIESGAVSIDKANRHIGELRYSLEGEGHRAFRQADRHAEKMGTAWVEDGFSKLNQVYDVVSPIGFIPYPPSPVLDYIDPDDPIQAFAVLTNSPKIIRMCRTADGSIAIPDDSGECPPGSLPGGWPWPGEPIGFPPEPGTPPAGFPPSDVPPDQPDIGTSPGTLPPPPPSGCPAPVVNCNPPTINVEVQPPTVYVSPAPVTVNPTIEVTVEGCVGSPCQPCSPPGPTVPPAPSPDPGCEPANKSLSLATARGWTVQPIDGETGSSAPWSQHYVIAGPTGIARRMLVTGDRGPTKAGRLLPGSTWNAFGLFTVPDGVRSTFVEWDPDPTEPPIDPDTCPAEPEPGEPLPPEDYDPCIRDNSCPPECDPMLGDCSGGDFPEPDPGSGGGAPSPPPPPPPTIPTRPPIGRLSDLSGPGGMIDGRDFCEWVQSVDQQDPNDPNGIWNFEAIWERMGLTVGGRSSQPDWVTFAYASLFPSFINYGMAIINLIRGSINAVDPIFSRLGITNIWAAKAGAAISSGIGWVQRISGADLSYYKTGLDYLERYQNPLQIPSQSELNGQLLADVIDQQQWECFTRANGNIPGHHQNTIRSQRARPNSTELLLAFKRGIIDGSQFARKMRENGFLEDGDVRILERLFEQIPTFGDIIRFMVRDSFNEESVKSGGFDAGFSENFTGKAREWAESQGLSEDVARAFWRAHWEFPSNTALYEMVRRLRPGRVEDRIAVTREDALQVLKINDVAPAWQEKLLAVSYNPLTRTDLKIGYMNGAIEEPELIERLQDTGLNRTDSEFVVELFRTEKSLRDTNPSAKILGWTRREIVGRYIDGTLSFDESRNLLIQFGMSLDDIAAVLSNADVKAEVIQRTKCSQAIRRRYYLAEFDDAEAVDQLIGIGFQQEPSRRIVSRWQCERLSRRKEIGATKNQALYLRGIIDRDEYSGRLSRLGYSSRNVQDLLLESDSRIAEKVQKSIIDALRKQEQAIKESVRKAEQKLKDLEKRIKEREKELKKKDQESNK